MQIGTLTITAPALNAPGHSEAEVFGSVVWLWMNAPAQNDLPLRALPHVLLPPLKQQQFILAAEPDGVALKPVAYVAWAHLDAQAEQRYLRDPANGLRREDWNSGDRLWITHWFTPFGHSRALRQIVVQLLADRCMRALDHRGHERGSRVLTFRGDRVTQGEADRWWAARPMTE